MTFIMIGNIPPTPAYSTILVDFIVGLFVRPHGVVFTGNPDVLRVYISWENLPISKVNVALSPQIKREVV